MGEIFYLFEKNIRKLIRDISEIEESSEQIRRGILLNESMDKLLYFREEVQNNIEELHSLLDEIEKITKISKF